MSYTYDAIGRLATVSDSKGATTKYDYNAADKINVITDAHNNTSYYSYDGNGNLKMLIDAKTNVIQYEYDNRDRITKREKRDASQFLEALTKKRGTAEKGGSPLCYFVVVFEIKAVYFGQ